MDNVSREGPSCPEGTQDLRGGGAGPCGELLVITLQNMF